jgi:propanol-preferring alcohol dehydrogenase
VPEAGTLAIFGFGSSANVILQIAIHRGYRVFVVTRGEAHARLARTLGASWAGADAAEIPDAADSAVVFAPVGTLVPVALRSLRKGGTLSLAGIHMSTIPAMDYDECLFYERDVRSVTANTREDGRALLEEAARLPVRPEVQVYPLAEANAVLQDLKSGRISGTAVLAPA